MSNQETIKRFKFVKNPSAKDMPIANHKIDPTKPGGHPRVKRVTLKKGTLNENQQLINCAQKPLSPILANKQRVRFFGPGAAKLNKN